jgi:hypothetical protein
MQPNEMDVDQQTYGIGTIFSIDETNPMNYNG